MTRKIALITGGNKGIGLETARQLAKQGLTVIITSRDPAKGEKAAQQLRSEGFDAESVELDVTNDASVAATAKVVASKSVESQIHLFE
jgi:NAD(P)-dependent dehydrogenase (short-subunit alcohol dehydrogenase family)